MLRRASLVYLSLSLMVLLTGCSGCCGERYSMTPHPSQDSRDGQSLSPLGLKVQDGAVTVITRGGGYYNDDFYGDYPNGSWLFSVLIQSDSAFCYDYRDIFLVAGPDTVYLLSFSLVSGGWNEVPYVPVLEFLWESGPPSDSMLYCSDSGSYWVELEFMPAGSVDMKGLNNKFLTAGFINNATDTAFLTNLAFSPSREYCR